MHTTVFAICHCKSICKRVDAQSLMRVVKETRDFVKTNKKTLDRWTVNVNVSGRIDGHNN